ncbi:MAG: glycosyltransferase family 39 protein [Candidatus Omnitrophica bacterium]|nr:glycosyltransferase family 39 protein [Candidatus Omnitrophota bacterium]MCM8789286.1 glycosyltransferase family 39 protein [Candidatus Omnitrophota bacterium]
MKRKKIIIFAIILFIGFALRILTLVQISSTALYNPVMMDKHDQKTFHLWAQSIIKHPVYVDGEAFYMAPLYAYFLAILYAISGGSIFFAGLVQGLLDTTVIFLIYLLGRKIKDQNTGIIAAFLYAFYQTIILYSITILSDGLIVFLNVLFIFVLYRAIETKKRISWVLSGLVLGLAALAKPTIIAFSPFIIIGLWLWPENQLIVPLEKKHKSLHLARVLLLGGIGFAMIILPVTLRNLAVSGKFVLICTNGPINWQIGNSSDSVGLFCYPRGDLLHPLEFDFWKLFFKKFLLFFNSYEWPQNLSIYIAREIIPALKFAFVRFGFIVSLGIVGIFLAARNRKNFLFVSFTIVQIMWVIMFFITDRYRLPAVACLTVTAGFLIKQAIDEIRAKKLFRPAVLLILAGLWAYISGWKPDQPFADMYWRIFAKLSKANIVYNLQIENNNLAEKVAKDYEKLLPQDPDSHFFLACVYAEKGNIDDAEKELIKTLNLKPDHHYAKEFLDKMRKISPSN